ncbi:YebC/PmpR family DNA-binding transcriptional regulator [Candidatus Berkelbacteria bacterium]|nr:YebC/PmpR family DNA-binding transcriptional regulator [Candidatus Berkelbacteria bacterium]
MSGHSKWSTIKRKKGAADAKRGQVFSKLAKSITVAARLGKNLDMEIAAAKAANMPKANIDRAIKRGTGELGDGVQIEEIVYEAYGPGGVAILIKTLTDNRNRTMGDLRAVANKFDLRLAESGSVKYLFDLRGVVVVDSLTEDQQLELIDAGADDFEIEADEAVIYMEPTVLHQVQQAVEALGLKQTEIKIAFVAKNFQTVDEETQDKVIRVLEALEDLEDVDSVETNADLAT